VTDRKGCLVSVSRRLFLPIVASLAAFPSARVRSEESVGLKKQLRVGFVPGPYIDEFRLAVEPQLSERGYTVKYYNFSTGLQVNTAVFNNEIDADVMQHSVYLKAYNERNGTDLTGIVQVPTPPMGLYSRKYRSAAEVKRGATVAVPNDPVNLERALKILRDLGWIELKAAANPVDVTELDVIKNPVGIKLVPLENAQGPRALEDVDFAAIQGNFAIYSGLKLTDAVATEKMTSPYINVVAVRNGNADSPWARDIAAAYQSEIFKKAIRAEPFYAGFKLPDYFGE
jgi:D-methionine transport system substrate-binding protein